MFPRIRLLMMLFMLLSMAGSLSLTASAAPATTDRAGAGAFQGVDLCLALDTDDNLNLTNDEISKLDQDLDGNGVVNDADRDIISSYCVAAPSTPINFVTICHATGSESKPFEVITINANAVIQGHLDVQHQGGEDIIPKFTYNGQTYGPQGDPSWIANGCQPPTTPDTYSLTVTKYFCTVDDETVEVPGPTIGTPDDSCVVATDQEFTLSLEGTDITTADLLAGVQLEPGTYNLYEGDTLLGPITIVDENVVVSVLNSVPDEDEGDGYITVQKRFCEADNSGNENSNCNGRVAPDVTVTFEVYNSQDEMIGTIEVTDFNEGNGSQGTAQSTMDLVVGEFYTVCEIAPEGWDAIPRPGAQGGANQTGFGDCITVQLVEGNNVLQFNNFPVEEEPGSGTVIVEKFYCEDDSIEAPVVGQKGDYKKCDEGTATFDLLDDTLEAGGESILGEGNDLFAGVELPLGTYYLVEWFDGEWIAMATVVIDEDGETVSYTVFNPVEPDEITIWIYKEVCADLKEIDPEHPKDPCVGWDDGLDGTVINFTVTVDDGNDAVKNKDFPASLTVVDGWGQTSVVVPEGVSYTVCEAVPGQVEELSFASTLTPTTAIPAEGCITFAGDDVIEAGEVHVLFQQTLKDEPEKPEQPEKPKPEQPKPPVKPVPKTVTGLPDTGSGTVDDGSMAPWMLIASAAVLAGTGALLRKERPAA